MESDSENECVWCRRPLNRGILDQVRRSSGVDLLRDSSDPDRTTTIFGAFAALAFIGIIVYALFGYSHKGAQASNVDPLSNIAPSQLSWTGDRTQQDSSYRPTAPSTVNSAVLTSMPANNRSTPAVTSQTVTQSQAPVSAQQGAQMGNAPLAIPDGGELPAAHIDKAKVMVSGGKLVASITIANDGQESIKKLKLSLLVGGKRYDLVPFRGSIAVPEFCAPGEIAAGGTVHFATMARDLDPAFLTEAPSSVMLQAWTSEKAPSSKDELKLAQP